MTISCRNRIQKLARPSLLLAICGMILGGCAGSDPANDRLASDGPSPATVVHGSRPSVEGDVSVRQNPRPNTRNAGTPERLFNSLATLVEDLNPHDPIGYLYAHRDERDAQMYGWPTAQAVAELMVAGEALRQSADQRWGEGEGQALIESLGPPLMSAKDLARAADAEWRIEGETASAQLEERLRNLSPVVLIDGVWSLDLPPEDREVIRATRETARMLRDLAGQAKRGMFESPDELREAAIAGAAGTHRTRTGSGQSIEGEHH